MSVEFKDPLFRTLFSLGFSPEPIDSHNERGNDMSKAEFLKQNLKDGERYAGLILGAKDYHLVAMRGESNVNWNSALIAAAMAGGELPTLNELRLMQINVRDLFADDTWHWSVERKNHADAHAYAISNNGTLGSSNIGSHLNCACIPVRRIYIDDGAIDSALEAAYAQTDADLTGVGFIVNGRRVSPGSVAMLYPTAAPVFDSEANPPRFVMPA